MNTSYTLQTDANERIEGYRKRQYPDSSGQRIKSNYILSKMIDAFPISEAQQLMRYKDLDFASNKKARSVTLSSEIHERLKKIASLLNLSESQACRYVIYYMSESQVPSIPTFIPSEVEEAIAILRKAVAEAEGALKTIEDFYSRKEMRLIKLEKKARSEGFNSND